MVKIKNDVSVIYRNAYSCNLQTRLIYFTSVHVSTRSSATRIDSAHLRSLCPSRSFKVTKAPYVYNPNYSEYLRSISHMLSCSIGHIFAFNRGLHVPLFKSLTHSFSVKSANITKKSHLAKNSILWATFCRR